MIKLDHIVLKGVICVYNVKIRSNGIERSQLGTQYKNQGHMVLKGDIWFEISNLGTQYKHQVKWS